MANVTFQVLPGYRATLEFICSPGGTAGINTNVQAGNTSKIDAKISPGNTYSNILVTIEPNTTYISGKVTKDSAAVIGAKVYLIDEIDNILVGTTTTGSDGNYRFEGLDPNKTYHVAVSWTDELDNKYNAESKPFITPKM